MGSTTDATKKSKRPIVFLGVGILNTLLDFLFFTLLTRTVFQNKDDLALAGIVSGTFALICAFTTHSLITWRGTHVRPITFVKFAVFTGFGMWVLRPILLSLFIHLEWLYGWVHSVSQSIGLPFDYDFIANTGAFGFMAVILLIYNYFVYERFVFTKKKPEATASRTDSENH